MIKKNKFSKDLLQSINIFPLSLENKDVFIKRFCRAFDVRATFKTKLERIAAAEQVWNECKKESIVSVKTSHEEFLLFE